MSNIMDSFSALNLIKQRRGLFIRKPILKKRYDPARLLEHLETAWKAFDQSKFFLRRKMELSLDKLAYGIKEHEHDEQIRELVDNDPLSFFTIVNDNTKVVVMMKAIHDKLRVNRSGEDRIIL